LLCGALCYSRQRTAALSARRFVSGACLLMRCCQIARVAVSAMKSYVTILLLLPLLLLFR